MEQLDPSLFEPSHLRPGDGLGYYRFDTCPQPRSNLPSTQQRGITRMGYCPFRRIEATYWQMPRTDPCNTGIPADKNILFSR